MVLTLAGFLVVACLLLQAALAAATPRYNSLRQEDITQAIPPSEDPWYTAPNGYTSASPGAILRTRTAPSSLLQAAGSNCSAAYQLLYRTTASQGNATFAVTTVLVPQHPTNALLSYQIPYDSAYINSSPSYTLSQGVSQDIKVALGKGYFVTVPDYEGPLASFTAGHMSGYATLDAVRATLNGADMYGLPNDTLYATWGYSGGALATEWAAELAVDYASELSFAGAAMGGLTPNVTSVLMTINMQISAGLAPPAIIGLLSQWPDTEAWVYSQLTNSTTGTYTAANFLAAEYYTLSQCEAAYKFQNIYRYFTDGQSVITGPEVTEIVDQDGVMGLHGVPQMPVYAYKAIQDQISVIADTDALVAKYCAAGANILYERNTVGNHGEEQTNGDPAATAFLDAVLTGAYAESYQTTGCTINNVTIGEDGGATGGWSGLPRSMSSWYGA